MQDVKSLLKTGLEWKEKGNAHFKAGELVKAKKAYGKHVPLLNLFYL